jgi:predicted phosphodiesterase
MRTLIVGDIHEPVTHPSYLRFCRHIEAKWRCNKVVLIGDVIDFHGVSFHAKNPNCPGPRDEAEQAQRGIDKWKKAFPIAEVMIGNHDERVIRLAATVGIGKKFIKDFKDAWDTPGWDWKYETVIEDTLLTHGTGSSGVRPAMLRAQQSCMNTIIGHVHSVGGIQWAAGPRHRLFGMDTGCGIDRKAEAMAYGRDQVRKPVLGCGVLIDGIPYYEIMPCGPGEKFGRRGN